MYVILAQTMNTLVYLCTIPIRWGEECNVINVQMYVVPSNSLQLLSTVKVKMCENFFVEIVKNVLSRRLLQFSGKFAGVA
jgi:hypothetical protein